MDRLTLIVDDIDAAGEQLISYGVEVSEVFHDAAGSLGAGFYADASARSGSRSRGPFLRQVRLIQRFRRQPLAASGGHQPAPRTLVGVRRRPPIDIRAIAAFPHET